MDRMWLLFVTAVLVILQNYCSVVSGDSVIPWRTTSEIYEACRDYWKMDDTISAALILGERSQNDVVYDCRKYKNKAENCSCYEMGFLWSLMEAYRGSDKLMICARKLRDDPKRKITELTPRDECLFIASPDDVYKTLSKGGWKIPSTCASSFNPLNLFRNKYVTCRPEEYS